MSFKILSNTTPLASFTSVSERRVAGSDHQPPFVLMEGNKIVESVFQFLKPLQLRGLSRTTLRAYAYDLLAFFRFLKSEKLSIDRLESKQITDFILSERQHHAAPRTINRRLISLRSYLNSVDPEASDRVFRQASTPFYKGMRNKALLGKSRLRHLRKSFTVKVPSVLITTLTPFEIRRFFRSLKKYRDRAITTLMIFCGLRSCEVLSLDMNDIDFIENQIHVHGKGGKERILPISPAVRQALGEYLDFERPKTSHSRCFVVLKGPHRGQPLTPEGLRMLFRHRRKISHLKKANAHKFRHTFCTNMIRQGMSLPVVQKLMGHSDIEVTLGYTHLTLDDVSREYQKAILSLQEPAIDAASAEESA